MLSHISDFEDSPGSSMMMPSSQLVLREPVGALKLLAKHDFVHETVEKTHLRDSFERARWL